MAETPAGPDDVTALGALSEALNRTEGIAFATQPSPNGAGDAAILSVFPDTAPQDEATHDLVLRLRRSVVPKAIEGSTAVVKVGGLTAAGIDFANYSGGRLPWFMGTVLVLSFLLLMAVFRSVLVPLKAVVMNLLSIGAACGLIVIVFQWGWGASLLGVGKEGPIEAWAPMMLFAILFGLSMDYEVFLLSRIREEYDRSGDNGTAVANGLAATARVITAAAAIMVVVFGSFVLGVDRSIKLFGLGLAVAVLLDATIVRMVLVPATMELLGDRNWWLPGWLGRWLPVIHVDATEDTGPVIGTDEPVILLPPDPDRILAEAGLLAVELMEFARQRVEVVLDSAMRELRLAATPESGWQPTDTGTSSDGAHAAWRYDSSAIRVRQLQDALAVPGDEWPDAAALRAAVDQLLDEARRQATAIVADGRRELRDAVTRRAEASLS